MYTHMVRISALLWADILVDYALFVMQKYLTDVWKLSFTHAAGILNIWNGISLVLPVFFRFLVDQLMGNREMLLISSIAYSLGIGFITMSVPPVLANSTGTCKQYEKQCIGNTQEALFYTGMVLIAVGMAGHLVSLRLFLDEQGDRSGGAGRGGAAKALLQIAGLTVVLIVSLVGAIALPYIKPWTLRFGIPAICTTVATLLFLTGYCYSPYEHEKPKRSPVTNICKVFVASICKSCLPFPHDENQYEGKVKDLESFEHTRCLRCLHKAAIRRDGQEKTGWKLCTVKEVEEAKIAVRMVPMWLTFIICGMVSSIGNTYFVEQGDKLDRHIGKWNVPLPALLLFFRRVKSIFESVADCIVQKKTEENQDSSGWFQKMVTPNRSDQKKVTPRKYRPPIGIGVAMVFSILCCITAAKIEQRRLNVIREHNLMEKPDEDIPMSMYWLLFQFFLLAGLDAFFARSVVAFYAYQAPETMVAYLEHLAKGVSGLGYMCNVLTVYIVGKISEKGGKPNWFQYTLNKSRLDRYYWLLAVLSSVNLIVFIVIAYCYRYKKYEGGVRESSDSNLVGMHGGEAEERQPESLIISHD